MKFTDKEIKPSENVSLLYFTEMAESWGNKYKK